MREFYSLIWHESILDNLTWSLGVELQHGPSSTVQLSKNGRLAAYADGLFNSRFNVMFTVSPAINPPASIALFHFKP
jgi:hypothetical protein